MFTSSKHVTTFHRYLLSTLAGAFLITGAVAQTTNPLSDLFARIEALHKQHDFSQALPLAKDAVDLSKQTNGVLSSEYAHALHILAVTYHRLGSRADADSAYNEAIVACRKLSQRHGCLSDLLGSLAALRTEQGSTEAAHQLLEEALTEHGDQADDESARLIGNLAAAFTARGDYASAEPLYRKAVQIRGRLRPSNEIGLSSSLNGLASTLAYQGKLKAAEELYKQALEIRVKSSNWRLVGATRSNLGLVYMKQGHYRTAEAELKGAVATLRTFYTHPDLTLALNALGGLYYSEGRYQEAEAMYKRVLQIRKRLVGAQHPDMAAPMNNLALLYQKQRRYREAETLFMDVLFLREQHFGAEHASVAEVLLNLAELHRERGDTEKSKVSFDRASAIPSFDTKHIDVWFGTNRKQQRKPAEVRFGGERAEKITFGRGTLVAARKHVWNRGERLAAGLGLLERSPNDLTPEEELALGRLQIVQALSDLRRDPPGSAAEALIFVHGYNVRFDYAMKRTAQVAFDLGFNGICLLFTWPSRGDFSQYRYDRASAHRSINYFVEFIDTVSQALPRAKLHIIAHQHGERCGPGRTW